MPRRLDDDGLDFVRFVRTGAYSYKVNAAGTVIRTCLRTYAEHYVRRTTDRRGRALVTADGRTYALKSVVARHFVPGWKAGAVVEHVDGDPTNCAAWNLRLVGRRENAARCGRVSGMKTAVPVTVDGREYESTRQAARGLHVSDAVLRDYAGGRVRKSVLDGKDVRRAKSDGMEQAR